MEKLDLAYINRFQNLTYEKFKDLAVDVSLSSQEKIGFPNFYRDGKEQLIWQDICNKLSNLALPNKLILDIGPGCSELPLLFINQAKKNDSKIVLCDSREMLSQLPESKHIEKIEGPFPQCWSRLSHYIGSIDVISVYSVFHYIIGKESQELFFDRCLDLLAHRGQLLLGDLPNNSKRSRFLASPTGADFDQNSNGSQEKNQLDDAMIFALIQRARKRGFEAYVLPQSTDLPMANRREDILVVR